MARIRTISFLTYTFLQCILLTPFVFASDSTWTETERAIIDSLSITRITPLPASPSNRYADDTNAQSMGKQIFIDTRFSKNHKLSCASCHQPNNFFTDDLPLAKGLHATGRNTPTVVGSAWNRWFYWDGRKDSLWSQALIPFEATNEMGSSRTSVVKNIISDNIYNAQYVELFGPFPELVKQVDLTIDAGPIGHKDVQDSWHRLSKPQQESINQIYVNIGKTLAAYQRTLTYQPTLFDRYVEQLNSDNKIENRILSDDEIAGLKLFINAEKTQCLQCHNTALFTNKGFHNIGSGNFTGNSLDFGRMFGLQAVLIDEFNCLGPYSDAQRDECTALKFLNKDQNIPLKGAFKTPGLRNVSQTSPYFHDGRFDTLEDVVNFYNNPPMKNGPHELKPMNLDSTQVRQLVQFLKSLN